MVQFIIIISFILSSLIANDIEKYRFVNREFEADEKYSYEMDVLTDFQIGGFSFQGTFSGLMNFKII